MSLDEPLFLDEQMCQAGPSRGRIFQGREEMKKTGLLRKWTEAVRAKFPNGLRAGPVGNVALVIHWKSSGGVAPSAADQRSGAVGRVWSRKVRSDIFHVLWPSAISVQLSTPGVVE
jgi:hypothetical protein